MLFNNWKSRRDVNYFVYCVYISIYTHTYTCIDIYTYIHICSNVDIQIMQVYMCIYIFMCISTLYLHMYIMYIICVYYISTYVYYIIYNIIYLYLHISTLKELSQKLEHLISDAQVCYTSESPEGRLNQNTQPMSISIDSDSISLGGAQSSELRILKVPRGFSCAVRL